MLTRSTYWLSQGARVGAFLGQYVLSARLSRPVIQNRRPRRSPMPAPTLTELLAELGRLLRRDWHNIRDGLYRLPHDVGEDPRQILARTIRYFDDLPRVNARRRQGSVDEVAGIAADRPGLPEYYLRNFHFQTDGYLSERSARLYDHQVEVLFLGGADAMRRQALVPLGAHLRRRAGVRPLIVDVGCGTGRFLAAVRHSFPGAATIGLDLSRAYLDEAARYLGRWPGAMLVEGLAEAMPVATAACDVVTAVYLLHEVPDAVRRRFAAECARVLRPGGRLILVDSLQFGDRPGYDVLLETFPDGFHEPYYADYAATDLVALLTGHGFRHVGSELAFLSKVMTFDRN